MKSQEKRIARFIESLPTESELGKDQASLLVTGAGLQVTVNDDCYNAADGCKGSANTGECKNESRFCGNTANQKCMILPNNCTVDDCPISSGI